MIEVLVSDNPLVWNVRDGVKRVEVEPEDGASVADVVREAVFRAGKFGAAWTGGGGGELVVIVDGTVYSAEAAEKSLAAGTRQVRVTVASGDPTTIVMLVLSVALSLASAALAPSLKGPRASGNNEANRAPGFGRFASEAVAGGVIPVVLGAASHVGGKIVSMAPGEGENGDQRLRVLICYGHGPIEAIGSFDEPTDGDTDGSPVTGVTGIYLQDRDISEFTTARVSVRLGREDQPPIPGFDDTTTLQQVGVSGLRLRNTDGVERTGGSASAEAVTYIGVDPVDALTLRVRFPTGLYHIGGSGVADSRTVKWRYRTRLSDVSGSPGSWGSWRVVTVAQALTAEFFSSPLVDFVPPTGPYTTERRDVQVERVSVEPADGSLTDVDDMWFDSVVERRTAANAYPGMAMLALDLTAGENLTGIPRVSADIKGFAACRVWDGVSPLDTPVFTEAYSANPAAVAFTYMTDPVWGLGMADTALDLESVARATALCDEVVSRPGGGTRPRFAMGLVVDTARADVEWPSLFLTIMRAQLISSGNRWRFVPDVPQTSPVEVYGEDDIVAGEDGLPMLTIGYEAVTGGVSKPNQLTAQFASDALGGRTATVVWPQPGELWLADEDVRQESQRLDGVTDDDQAMADVVYRMKRIRGAVRTVSLTTARDVPAVQPGDRFDLSAPDVGFGVASGLLRAGSTADAPMLDQDVTLDAGESYTLTVTAADGTIDARVLSNKEGVYRAGEPLSVATAFAADVATGPVRYALGRVGRVVLPLVCTRLAQVEGPAGKLHWQVEGVEYVAESFDDEAVDVPRGSVADYLDHSSPPGPMLTLAAGEVVRSADGAAVVMLTWTQRPQDRAITAGVRTYRRLVGTDAWVLMPVVFAGREGTQIPAVDLDLPYQFVAVAVTATGVGLSPDDPRHPVAGVAIGAAAAPPEPPAGLAVTVLTGNRYRLSWDAADGAVGYQVLGGAVEDGSAVNGGAADGVVIGRTAALYYDLVLAPGVESRFWVRSVGATGRLSFMASTVVEASPATPVGMGVRDTAAFDLSTDGTPTNLTWSTDRLRLDDGDVDGVWESGEVDLGSAADTEIVVQLEALNDAEDPAIEDVAFGVPSTEADQWGVVSGSGGTAVVGMLMPPYPDTAQSYTVELKVHDGSGWGVWQTLAAGAVWFGLLAKYNVRVTIRRGVDGTPYRPSLAGVTVVAAY